MATTIEIDDMITVGALAEQLQLPVSRLIAELMKNGVMVTVNERIDFDTAQILVTELGLDVELVKHQAEVAAKVRNRTTNSKTAVARPPVVAVMGHVDHGKTTLLDAIRGSEVAKKEAGGITQHISAYQVEHNGRAITFLDTPGHEAFAALREHGAQLTDLVIIVVAADDGVKPQTIEAIRFALKANVKLLVAITKIDKETADTNRVKQQLAEQNILVEGWGGDTVVVPVSAKTGEGVDQLLDMVLLVADVEELKAEVDKPARGLIIESHMEQGRGPVAVALIEEGTLKNNDFVVAGTTYAKIRNLELTTGKDIKTAGPSTPVLITGFKNLPEFGDEFLVVQDEKIAREAVGQAARQQGGAGRTELSGNELLRLMSRNQKVSEFNVIIKADVQGSLTSVIDSLKTLDTDEVAVRIVGTGVGQVVESDLHLARTTNAVIYAFNVDTPTNLKRAALRDGVVIRSYRVIYELIDDVRQSLTALLVPHEVETPLGRLIVKGIFKRGKTEVICGGEVTKGKLASPAEATVNRGKEKLGEVHITRLQRGPQEVNEVNEGEMCGVSFNMTSRIDLQEGDQLEFFRREIVERTL